jgi:hypothetical protein
VLDTNGKVIGVAVGSMTTGQNLNFAVPVFYVSELLANVRPVVPLASVTPQPSASQPAGPRSRPQQKREHGRAALDDQLEKARTELLASAREYKASLERLLARQPGSRDRY